MSLDKFLILDSYYLKLTFGVFTAPCLFILNKKYNVVSEVGFEPTPTYVDLINDLRVSLDNFLILDRYSILEADLRCFCCSLSLYIKQEIQHGIKRNVLVCSATDVYLSIYSTQAYVGKR